MTHPLAGTPAPHDLLISVPELMADYYSLRPDATIPDQRIGFGTSGHRGSSSDLSFNEDHILAITQAVSEYRSRQGVRGPLFVGADSHALSEAALRSAVEVFAANGVDVVVDRELGFTPTPVISHAILTHNRETSGAARADGVVITPSHNPPRDGGFKYNPPHGGPAGTETTGWIERRANEFLEGGLQGVARLPFARALAAETTHRRDLITPYVADLDSAVDLEAVAASGIRIGVDPMGGAALAYWAPITERYRLDLTVVNDRIDPTFSFMTVDGDGKIRMDCSSPYAMASLIGLKDRFDIAFGNDPDADRHGIVTPTGLMNPNHYLAVAINYLFEHRPEWPSGAAVGKTLVSSSLIDWVAADLERPLLEVPVGFKWFVDGLLSGSCAFGGEESAGASFLRRDGHPWTTDKDGIILGLLAAEIAAVTSVDPAEHYRHLETRFGSPLYRRSEASATPRQKAVLASLSPEVVSAEELAGDRIVAKLIRAPGNDAPLGGLKVVSEGGWFAARPSGTEDIYKIYAESFRGEAHLERLIGEARDIVQAAFAEVKA